MDKRGGESIKIFRRNFFSHSAEKFRRGTFSCFINFGYRKMLGIYRKNIWHDSDSNPEPTAWEPCCPNRTAVIYFWKKKSWQFWSDKKIKKRKTTLLNE